MLKLPYLTGTTSPRVVELRALDKGGLIGVRQLTCDFVSLTGATCEHPTTLVTPQIWYCIAFQIIDRHVIAKGSVDGTFVDVAHSAAPARDSNDLLQASVD